MAVINQAPFEVALDPVPRSARSLAGARPAGDSAVARQPALDAVRGLSILLVLFFHGGWSWMSGGYVGVSVFFTLSGFLITRLLLREHATHGRINVVRFWGRRIRRLAPASVTCLLAVALLGAVGGFGDVSGLGRDLLGAVSQLANWFELAGDASYSDRVLGRQSPVAHYWSLAIEEQFYLVWPLVMVAVLRRRRPAATIATLAVLTAIAAPVIAVVFGADAAYWATPARAGEIMAGAALAAVLERRDRRLPRWIALLAVPALVAIVWAATTWPPGSGPAYAGWFPLLAIASAALILALQVPSPVRRAMGLRPLVALGAVSYGVYLYHWPVFLLLDGELGVGRWLEFTTKVAVTVALAALSYRVLELPVRRGRLPRQHAAPALVACAAAVVLIAAVGPFAGRDRFDDPDEAVSQLRPVASWLPPLVDEAAGPEARAEPLVTVVGTVVAISSSVPPAAPIADVPEAATDLEASPGTVPDVALAVVPSRPVRILVVGDSTAWSLGDGLAAWATQHPELASVTLNVSPGCGFIQGGRVPADDGSGYAAECGRLLGDTMMRSLRDLQPDVVVLMTARTDVKHREWDAGEGTIDNLDPRFQERQLADYRNLTEWVLGAGAGNTKVMWVKPLVVRADPAPADETADPERIAALHAVIDATIASSDPDRVGVVDLAGWYATAGLDDHSARIDGIHFELPAATQIAARLLGPELVNVAVTSGG